MEKRQNVGTKSAIVPKNKCKTTCRTANAYQYLVDKI